METREVVKQVFDELKALLGPYDRLIITMRIDGRLEADLIDRRDNGRAAVGLDHVVNVLAARIKAK